MRNQLLKTNWFHGSLSHRLALICYLTLFWQNQLQADQDLAEHPLQPAISIIIDDMGYRLQAGKRALALPGEITYSFLPHSPYVKLLTQIAYQQKNEIMLHLPMEAESGKVLGPGGLTESMSHEKFNEVLQANIQSIPHMSGFNNHMGSLLTKSTLWMKKLMLQITTTHAPIYFVDSKTTRESVAMKMAQQQGLPSIQRDIFIDHDSAPAKIKQQLKRLIKKAKQRGTALAIAHPKKNTLRILEKWLNELPRQGVKLVAVSRLIELQRQRKLALWQKSHP